MILKTQIALLNLKNIIINNKYLNFSNNIFNIIFYYNYLNK